MIKSRIKAERSDANLSSYAETYRSFSWSEAEAEFTWKDSNLTNIAFEAIDRHALDQRTPQSVGLGEGG